jgi:hypothetical protein
MNAKLLTQYFGTDRQWKGPCVVILDAEATIQTSGSDAIVQSGAKVYAPRMISGRVAADFACLLPDEQSLLLVQTHRIRQATGDDLHQRTLLVVALSHVAAVEFPDLTSLKSFGVADPQR